MFDDALRTLARTGLDAITWAASGLAWCALVRADGERCAELCERTVKAARELGDPVTEAFAHGVLALDETMRGRAEASLARGRENEARVIAAGAGFTLPLTRTEMARARAALGDLEGARELLEAVVAGGADSGWHLCRALLALGDVLRGLGDADGTRARVGEALELSERVGARSLWATGRELLAWLAIGRGDWGEAHTLAHEVLTQRVEIGALAWLPQSLDRLAQVAAGLESETEAARLLGAAGRARSDFGLVRWPPDAPAFEELQRALARKLGPEAYAVAHAEGNAMQLDDAIAWVRRARGARKRPSGGWESLTPTERKVVELLAEGLTNPQIAARMFVARATVKAHLAHVFQKLDVSSRSELTAMVVRRAG